MRTQIIRARHRSAAARRLTGKSKQPEAAVAVLHNDVLPFYANPDLPVKAVLTDRAASSAAPEGIPTNSTLISL